MDKKFLIFNLDKLKRDKDYFIVVLFLNITMFGVPIVSLANEANINIHNLSVQRDISTIVCFAITLMYLSCIKKEFKLMRKN
ncbi:hypothetical protein [Romboutsia lituseburensis]|uniref:hypothetical protein n=1 Tax=Romboutsia lituseburensis TaxID=1537 RepID=UPI0022EABDEE|nr:hypothetical protein [Romboutsia lituseburensis]